MTNRGQGNSTRKWYQSIWTDDEWDVDGVLCAILFAVLFDCVMTAFKGPAAFDPQAFGVGIAAILGAGGSGYCAKRWGERSNAKDKDDVDSCTDVPKG